MYRLNNGILTNDGKKLQCIYMNASLFVLKTVTSIVI